MVLAVNKWDGTDASQKEQVKRQLDVKLSFLDFARTHHISALHGSGVGLLLASVRKAYDAATRKLPTPLLNEVLEDAVTAHSPPMVQGRRIKLRYAHQGGQNPPIIVIHGNQTDKVPATYRRYLTNVFRQEFDLAGTPVRVEFKSGHNPFEGKKNVLTPRQIARRKRLMRFVKKR
jgi:GTP-binding protein